jgi:hypothetical protein
MPLARIVRLVDTPPHDRYKLHASPYSQAGQSGAAAN